jgi:hypothetical protein
VPHCIWPAGQLATHSEPEHSGVAAGHAVPQAPQFAPSAVVLTQPLLQALSPAWHMHEPLQTCPELQPVPQTPQFMTSVFVFTQAGPQAARGAGQVQAPLVQVCVAPHGVAHWPTLPPTAAFPPIPLPPTPPLPETFTPAPPLADPGLA